MTIFFASGVSQVCEGQTKPNAGCRSPRLGRRNWRCKEARLESEFRRSTHRERDAQNRCTRHQPDRRQ